MTSEFYGSTPTQEASSFQMLTRVDDLDFTIAEPQLFDDRFRNMLRWCRYFGECETCHSRCYAFDDGENDPRGVLSVHAASEFLATDYGMVARDPSDIGLLCAICASEYGPVKNLETRYITRIWMELVVDINCEHCDQSFTPQGDDETICIDCEAIGIFDSDLPW